MKQWHDFLLGRGARFDRERVLTFGDGDSELAAARDAAVVCDLAPLGALSIAGPDAAQFLHGQLTSDVLSLERGAWQYAAWCSPKGRMLVNFVVTRPSDQRFELLFPRSLMEPIRKRLGMFLLRSKAAIADASAASVRLGIGGPGAQAAARAICSKLPDGRRSTDADGASVMSLPGPRFVAWIDPDYAADVWERITAVARPAGFASWEWLTIRAGVPVITAATSDQYVPQMTNWDALEGVSFNKGCYSGQEIVARMHYLGRLKERMVLANVDASPPAAGTRLFSEVFGDQPCGGVINAAQAPDGGCDLLAVVQLAAQRSAVRLASQNGPQLGLLPLPYALPDASAAQGRTA